jgi:hypothetical protein
MITIYNLRHIGEQFFSLQAQISLPAQTGQN